MGRLILSPETILNDSLFKNFQTVMAINAFRDTLNNSNLPAFLYKCDTINFLNHALNDEQPELNSENDYPNNTGDNLKSNSLI